MPVVPAVIGGVAAIGGALIAGSAARSAASEAARGSRYAIDTQREMAAEAKKDILNRMVPALREYQNGIRTSQREIANGSFDVIQTMKEYVGNADAIIESTGADAQRALMGSTASARGMPVSQFNSMYSTMQSAPPSARTQMMNNFQQTLASGAPQAMVGGQIGAAPAAAGQIGAGPVAQGAPPVDTSNIQTLASQGGQAPATMQTGNRAGLIQPGTTQAQIVRPQGLGATAIGNAGTGFSGAMTNLQQGYQTGQRALDAATAQARTDVTGQTSSALQQLAQTRESALGRYAPYAEAGQAAIGKEAALSGAMGPEAQQQAIDAYIESPGQQYLREQQEKALLRSQAAIGGLGGGNIRSALQEQAMGIASTQQQQYLENLRSLATRGQDVAGAETGIIGQTGMLGAQMTQGAGDTLAGISQQYGISSADLASMTTSQMANFAQQTGINISELQRAVGTARAGLQTELGSGIATAQGAAASDIAGLYERGATTSLSGQQNISQMLANLATGTGANVSNLQVAQGNALAAGQYLQGQAWAEGLQGLGQIAMNTNWNQQQPQSTYTTA